MGPRAYTPVAPAPTSIGAASRTAAPPAERFGLAPWLLLLPLGAAAALLSWRCSRSTEVAGLGDGGEVDELRENPQSLIIVEAAP